MQIQKTITIKLTADELALRLGFNYRLSWGLPKLTFDNTIYDTTSVGWNKFITQNPNINVGSFSELINQRIKSLIKKEISYEISSFNHKFIPTASDPELKLDTPCDLIITCIMPD